MSVGSADGEVFRFCFGGSAEFRGQFMFSCVGFGRVLQRQRRLAERQVRHTPVLTIAENVYVPQT
jgi:hypothetical protein